jgi:hypothetical protein
MNLHGRKILDAVPFEDCVNFYAAFAKSYRQGEKDAFYGRYPYDIRPVNDDRPFFYHFFHVADLFNKPAGRGHFEAAGGALGWSLLLFLVAFSVTASVILIILPLLVYRRRKIPTHKTLSSILFFTAIGLAYISIEMATIQRFSLFLGHPVLSMACIMSTFLCVSGIGSLFSNKWKAAPRKMIIMAVLAILLLVAGHILVVPGLQVRWLHLALPWRVALSVLLIAPLAFCMGMFFPTGIRRLATINSEALPWACAANGSASVVGSVCSILVAIQLGFSHVMLVGGLLYILAMLAATAGMFRGSREA